MRTFVSIVIAFVHVANSYAADAAMAAVFQYIRDTKHWRSDEYRVDAHGKKGGYFVFWVTYLPGLKQRQPNGRKSFEALYDPRTGKVTKVLHTD
jgi:hypothetical protein